jgi:DNA invertase Pin-like site-specific DNA recombinase
VQVERLGLREALSHLREADTLVVWKLDRLGRSVKGLVDLVNELETKKVHFQSVTDGVDTKTPAGRFFFHVMASLAQMERELIMERTRAGLEVARCQGRVGGRKRQMTDSKLQLARKPLASGTPPQEMAHGLGVSVISMGAGLFTDIKGVAIRGVVSARNHARDRGFSWSVRPQASYRCRGHHI